MFIPVIKWLWSIGQRKPHNTIYSYYVTRVTCDLGTYTRLSVVLRANARAQRGDLMTGYDILPALLCVRCTRMCLFSRARDTVARVTYHHTPLCLTPEQQIRVKWELTKEALLNPIRTAGPDRSFQIWLV